MVDSNQDLKTIEEFGSLTDIAPDSTDITTLLDVSFQQISSTYSRSQGIYSYYIKSGGSVLSSGQYISVDFPQEFGRIINLKPPTTCKLVDSATSSTVYGSGCTVFGSRVYVQITDNLPASSEFILSLDSITNPEDFGCFLSKSIVTLVSADHQTVNQRSTIGTSNLNQLRFQYSSSLQYVEWYNSNNVQILFNYNKITLKTGVFSELITLKPRTNPFSKMLKYSKLSIVGATFNLLGDQQIFPGQTSELIRLGCPTNSILGEFILTFSKEELTPVMYGDLGLLTVQVVNEQAVIKPNYFRYKIIKKGISLPIIFDFSDQIPVTQLILNFLIVPDDPDHDPRFVLIDEQMNSVNYLSVAVDQNYPAASIKVKQFFPIATVTDLYTSTLSITLDGIDKNSFVVSTTPIKLVLIETDTNEQLSFNIVIEESAPSSIYHTALLSVGFPSIINFHFRFTDGPSRSLQEVQYQVKNKHIMSHSDLYQEQFGEANVEGGLQLQINNLLSKKSYQITFWATDQQQRIAGPQTFIFSTKNNNGRLMKANFTYTKALTVDQKINITCWLCQYFMIPCTNVLTFEGIYCESYSAYAFSIFQEETNVRRLSSRILNPNDKPDNDHNLRKLINYKGEDRSFEKHLGFVNLDDSVIIQSPINGDEVEIRENPIYNSKNTFISDKSAFDDHETSKILRNVNKERRNLAADSSVTQTFYFAPSNDQIQDISWNRIIKSITSTTFLGLLNGNFSDYPQIMQLNSISEVISFMQPEIVSTPEFDHNLTWINIKNLVLRDKGLIYIYLVDSKDAGIPSSQQMKFKLNIYNHSVETFRILYYDGVVPVESNFTDLKNGTSYAFYAMVNVEDPTLFSSYSKVYMFSATTWNLPAEVVISAKITTTILSLMVILMFFIVI